MPGGRRDEWMKSLMRGSNAGVDQAWSGGDVRAMVNGLRFKTARDLFAAYPVAAHDMRAQPTDQPSLEFCRSLLEGRVPEEAITFCAYLLHERAAIWWGHECLGHLTDLLDEQDLRLLALVQDWVSEPQEHRRHAAMDEAAASGQRTPAVWLALAAGWDSRDPAAHRAPVATPRPFLAARAVNIGILAGLARVAVADRLSVLTAFVETGIQLAEMEALRAVS